VRCRLGAGTTARFSAGIVKAGQRPGLPGLLRLWGRYQKTAARCPSSMPADDAAQYL